MSRDIRQYVKSCHKCKINKPTPTTRLPLCSIHTPDKPFEEIEMDTIGPLTASVEGFKYAVTVICNLSKYLITIPVQDKSATTIAKAIVDNIYLIYGPFKKVITDKGSE